MSKVEYLGDDPKKFRILMLSNSVFSPSGYGVQSNGMLYDWVKTYDVRQLSNYGVQGRMIGLNGLQIYPNLPSDDHGNRTAQLIFGNWKPHLFFTLYDIWMGAYVEHDPTSPLGLKAIHPFWVPCIMVDHDPVPEATVISAAAAYRVISPTVFGKRQLEARGVKTDYIPFGISTDVWRPVVDDAERREGKRWLNERSVPMNINNKTEITEDSFVLMMNGANKDPYRKGFMRFFTALQIFMEQNPDAQRDVRVYLHSWMKQARDLTHGAKVLNVDRYIRCAADYHMLCGVPEDAMARITRSVDLFVQPTEGGGFEIPVLEAIASGVPVAATKFLGLPELVKTPYGEAGYLIPFINQEEKGKGRGLYFSVLDATQALADEFVLADAIADAYNHPEKRAKMGEIGRQHSLEYRWEIVNGLYRKLIEEARGEMRYTEPKERMV